MEHICLFNKFAGVNSSTKKKVHPLIKVMTHLVICIGLRPCDVLPSPLLDPLEGPSTLNCGKLGLEGRS